MSNLRKFRFIHFILLVVLAPAFFWAYYQYENRLFLLEAEIIWGSQKFAEKEFQHGSPSMRANMAVDLIRSKKFIGSRCDIVTEILGEKTGDYYKSDSNSTYQLTNKKSGNWILTFVCGDLGTIEKVFIRKSCCSVSQKLIYFGMQAVGIIKHQNKN